VFLSQAAERTTLVFACPEPIIDIPIIYAVAVAVYTRAGRLVVVVRGGVLAFGEVERKLAASRLL
jgi:hypothetical protein